MKPKALLRSTVAVGPLLLAGAAFAQQAHSSRRTVVTTRKSSLGTILVTRSGHTLYLDVSDRRGHPACGGGCLKVWPPLDAHGALVALGAARKAELGTTTIAGVKVVTYAGHPLYTFASDTRAGQTNGEGVNGFYVVGPSGRRLVKPAAPSTTTTATTTPTPTTPTTPTTTTQTTTTTTTQTTPTMTAPTTTPYPTTTTPYVY